MKKTLILIFTLLVLFNCKVEQNTDSQQKDQTEELMKHRK